PGNEAQVSGFAGPINPAICKQVSSQLLRRSRINNATDVESRKLQGTISAPQRHEGIVGILLDKDHQWNAVPPQITEFGKLRMSSRVGGRGHYRLAVIAKHFDQRPRYRLTGVDRLHEDIPRSVGRKLHSEAQIRHQYKPGILNRLKLTGHRPVAPVPNAATF